MTRLTCLMPSLRKTCRLPIAQRMAAGEAGVETRATASTVRNTAAHASGESRVPERDGAGTGEVAERDTGAGEGRRGPSARYRVANARNLIRCGYPLAINVAVSSACRARTYDR